MTCHNVSGKDKEGKPFFAIACTRGSGPRKGAMCDVEGCGATHEKLCDWPMAGTAKTCDRKLCRAHAHKMGPNKDYCPAHYVESMKEEKSDAK